MLGRLVAFLRGHQVLNGIFHPRDLDASAIGIVERACDWIEASLQCTPSETLGDSLLGVVQGHLNERWNATRKHRLRVFAFEHFLRVVRGELIGDALESFDLLCALEIRIKRVAQLGAYTVGNDTPTTCFNLVCVTIGEVGELLLESGIG